MFQKKEIALIYFSRSANAEAKEKSWVRHSGLQNSEIASALIFQSDKIVQGSELTVFHYHEGNQTGNTFGERLGNAYQEVFDRGYKAAIAIGNDSPELASMDWKAAIHHLQDGNCVLGPSMRGGAYFVGLTAEVFNKKSFSTLPWQTGRILTELWHYCQGPTKPVIFLDRLRDINTFHDLVYAAKSELTGEDFRCLLLQLLHKLRATERIGINQNPNYTAYAPSVPGRAPPQTADSL